MGEINGRCVYGGCNSCTCGAYGKRTLSELLHHLTRNVSIFLPVSVAHAAEAESEPNAPKKVQTPLGEFLIVEPQEGPEDDRSGTIGVQIAAEDGTIEIRGVAQGSPAAQAGLEAGQRILSIDGRSTRGMKLQTAAEALRGKPGTLVVLRIKKGILPWGKKVPLIRSSASFSAEAQKERERVRFESVPLSETGRKECPAEHEGCYFLFLGDGDQCTYACRRE